MGARTAALVLATLVVGQTSAASVHHQRQHGHGLQHVERVVQTHQYVSMPTELMTELRPTRGRREVGNRSVDDALSASDASKILELGLKSVGLNPTSISQTPWVGTDGQFTNQFVNQSGEDLVLVLWGPAGSWVNAIQPQLTISIPTGGRRTVSFPVGWSGAWAPVYTSTTLRNGQIFDTWGEGTFNPPYSVVDVSREANTNGRPMSVVGPQCTTDMNTCVFQCVDNVDQCLTGYELVNCATGSQVGATFGTYQGADSGGCGGMGSSAALVTYLG